MPIISEALVLVLVVFLMLDKAGESLAQSALPRVSANAPINSQIISVPALTLSERKLMNDRDRTRWLEQNGVVPADAEEKDWLLSTNTTWWATPLNPTNFWNGKVLWLDAATVSLAYRHGRRYPPIPYNFQRKAEYLDKPETYDGMTFVGAGVSLHSIHQERVFWYEFAKSHPHPPGEIALRQKLVASLAFRSFSSQSLADSWQAEKEIDKLEPIRFGYPKEAFSDDAIFWFFVENKGSSTFVVGKRCFQRSGRKFASSGWVGWIAAAALGTASESADCPAS